MNPKVDRPALPAEEPDGKKDRLMAQIVDDAEILDDRETETTRFVVWRKIGTTRVSVAMVQNGEIVSVNANNIMFLAAKVLPQFLK